MTPTPDAPSAAAPAGRPRGHPFPGRGGARGGAPRAGLGGGLARPRRRERLAAWLTPYPAPEEPEPGRHRRRGPRGRGLAGRPRRPEGTPPGSGDAGPPELPPRAARPRRVAARITGRRVGIAARPAPRRASRRAHPERTRRPSRRRGPARAQAPAARLAFNRPKASGTRVCQVPVFFCF